MLGNEMQKTVHYVKATKAKKYRNHIKCTDQVTDVNNFTSSTIHVRYSARFCSYQAQNLFTVTTTMTGPDCSAREANSIFYTFIQDPSFMISHLWLQ